MRFIVTTTISEPTAATLAFAKMPGWKLVVVGDLKTPHERYLKLDGVTYLHPQEQAKLDPELSGLIGWNCIQRRNMGFLYAARQGADLVATVDDDNMPLLGWGEHVAAGQTVRATEYHTDLPAFDPLWATEHSHLWHRGFPFTLVGQRWGSWEFADVPVAVQANLWNGDPDIDAACRTLFSRAVTFRPLEYWLTSRQPMPFNSQNTILTRQALGDYFCFPGVGRYDDIWGAYVCQAHGHRVVFGSATVEQHRQGHDLRKDMAGELNGYVETEPLVRAMATDREAWRKFVPAESARAFDRYRHLMQCA